MQKGLVETGGGGNPVNMKGFVFSLNRSVVCGTGKDGWGFHMVYLFMSARKRRVGMSSSICVFL